jgi:hypothetical protein
MYLGNLHGFVKQKEVLPLLLRSLHLSTLVLSILDCSPLPQGGPAQQHVGLALSFHSSVN